MEIDDDRESLRRELERRPTEELAAILRDRDEDEWRPEVFGVIASILASRGVSTADLDPPEPEGMDVVEGQELVTVGRYLGPGDAHAHRMALEGAGLQAWVCDETLGSWYGVGVGCRLQVRVDDEAAALAVLEAEGVSASAVPSEPDLPPCPRCGSGAVSQPGLPSERYQCGPCGHSWVD